MTVCGTAVTVVLVSVAWVYIPQLLSPKLKPVWGGFTHKDFKHVEEIFRQAVEDGRFKGGAVSAYYKGELVVDLWGGYADVEAERPWRDDTVTMVFSTTKLIGAIVIATMVEKGLLDYKKPVAHYWPEFGQNGKDKITVEMLLSHQAGLVAVKGMTTILDVKYKPEETEKLLSRQVPEYYPGSPVAYHAVSYGLYVDTLARKVDPKHRNMSQIFEEDIAEPFGIDFHIALPKALHHRSARMYLQSFGQTLWNIFTSWNKRALEFVYMALTDTPWSRSLNLVKEMKNFNTLNDPEVASVGITSYSGQGTARSVSKFFSILANGGTSKGKRLLSPKTIKYLGTPVAEGSDGTLWMNVTYGPGPFLSKNPKGQIIFGHPGVGGQVGFADPNTGLSFCYCTNHLGLNHIWDDPLLLTMQDAVYEGIGLKKG